MKHVYVTRRARFNAAHKLWNDDWSKERNLDCLLYTSDAADE